jgi:glycosyltransferase involved in cell wall biosynthesis
MHSGQIDMSHDLPRSNHSHRAGAPAPTRPAIAIISNSQTPYRLHLHRRIAAEIPEIQLHSVYTHEISNSKWEYQEPPEIGPVLFGPGETCEDQDKITRIPREWARGRRIIHWLKQNQIKFVLMMGYNDIGRLRMIRWCKHHRIPVFMFGDSNIYGDNRTGLPALVKKIVVGWVVRSCSGILACGSLGKRYFLKYGANPDRIFYYPYEPDYELIHSVPPATFIKIKEHLGFREDRRRLVYCGRLVSHKRVDLLFSAFLAIAHQRPEWDLVVIGAGPDRLKLKNMIPHDLSERVVWAGFLDDQSVVSAIYRSSDVLVLPSDFEPWALVINEAVCAGMAIISSNVVGASAELVRDGVNGKLFPPGDLKALTTAILDVTAPGATVPMRAASPGILADWRQRGDPVNGLRSALKSVGVLADVSYGTDVEAGRIENQNSISEPIKR